VRPRFAILAANSLVALLALEVVPLSSPALDEAHKQGTPPATPQTRIEQPGAKGPSYEKLTVEGWTVHVSGRLRLEEREATAAALQILQRHLQEIVRVVPARAVAFMRTVPLWMSPEYPGIQPRAEYHPNINWLREQGRNPAMAKGIEFTNIRIFAQENQRMPVFVLHELAHAYHDQVLGFDHPAIKAAYKRAVESKSYDAVENHKGQVMRAYAMSDEREYFAEETEAFFGRNDFYPFTREELKQHDPVMFDLLVKVWNRQ
jgi:hypothetical protein